MLARSNQLLNLSNIRLLSGWLLPTEPFSSTMWTAELISFVSIFITITIVRVISRKSTQRLDIVSSFFQTFALFVQQSIEFA